MADRTPVIVGIGLSDYPVAPHLDAVQHHVLAMQRALADSGVAKADIDGYMCAGGGAQRRSTTAVTMAEYLRHRPPLHRRHDDRRLVVRVPRAARGRGDPRRALRHRADHLRLRPPERAGAHARHRRASSEAGERVPGPLQYEAPYGNVLVGAYAMAARRHMHEFGTTSEQLAEIAVGVREHAALNPNARYRDPITVDDVVGVADDRRPAAHARLLRDHRRRRRGHHDHRRAGRGPAASRPSTCSARPAPRRTGTSARCPTSRRRPAPSAGPEAFARPASRPTTSTRIQFYDSFTITVLLILEDLGFCKKGEGGPFVEGGTCAAAARCRSTPTAAGSARATPGCAASSCSSRRSASCAARPARRRCPTARSRSPSARAAGCRASATVVLGKEHP